VSGLDGELFQVVVAAVVDVEVYVAVDARQCAGIGVLPEFPLSLILHLAHIVVGYPVGIVVEALVAEILLLKIVIGIKNGLHMIAVFHDVKPCEDVALEVFHGALIGLVLDVEHGGQVAFLQVDLLQEVVGLVACRRVVAPEVVGPTHEAVLASLVEIAVEVFVE